MNDTEHKNELKQQRLAVRKEIFKLMRHNGTKEQVYPLVLEFNKLHKQCLNAGIAVSMSKDFLFPSYWNEGPVEDIIVEEEEPQPIEEEEEEVQIIKKPTSWYIYMACDLLDEEIRNQQISLLNKLMNFFNEQGLVLIDKNQYEFDEDIHQCQIQFEFEGSKDKKDFLMSILWNIYDTVLDPENKCNIGFYAKKVQK